MITEGIQGELSILPFEQRSVNIFSAFHFHFRPSGATAGRVLELICLSK